jgi:hypothetical protein
MVESKRILTSSAYMNGQNAARDSMQRVVQGIYAKDDELRKFWYLGYDGKSMDNEPTVDDAFRTLVQAANVWVSKHMDQWEKFKFQTDYGPIYVTISMADPYPDSFDLVDRETGIIITQAGMKDD